MSQRKDAKDIPKYNMRVSGPESEKWKIWQGRVSAGSAPTGKGVGSFSDLAASPGNAHALGSEGMWLLPAGL